MKLPVSFNSIMKISVFVISFLVAKSLMAVGAGQQIQDRNTPHASSQRGWRSRRCGASPTCNPARLTPASAAMNIARPRRLTSCLWPRCGNRRRSSPAPRAHGRWTFASWCNRCWRSIASVAIGLVPKEKARRRILSPRPPIRRCWTRRRAQLAPPYPSTLRRPSLNCRRLRSHVEPFDGVIGRRPLRSETRRSRTPAADAMDGHLRPTVRLLQRGARTATPRATKTHRTTAGCLGTLIAVRSPAFRRS